MKVMWAVLCLALGVSATAAAIDEREEVRQAETGFAATMARRDHAAFASFLAEDTVFFGREGPLRGKAAVAAAWKRFYEGKEAPFSWAPDTVEILEPHRLAFTSGPVFDPAGQRGGTFNSVWRKEKNGEWRIIFDKGCPPCDCAAPEKKSATEASPDRFAALDAVVRDELASSGAPGAAVAIVDGGRIALARGYGLASVETRAPVDASTLFQIGSVTKPFTAAAVVSASLDATLPLETPVGQVVPGLRACVGAATIGQLLAHLGGLIDEPDEFGPQGEDGLASYPRTWADEYCLLPPGRAFSYSNSGYALAGLALQERSGRPYADVLRARVLEPLGMTRTTFRPAEAMTWPLAVGHRRQDGAPTVVRPLPNDARLWPAGTLYSSAQEMARFLMAMLDEGRVEGRQALPPGVIRAMTTAHAPMTALEMSYGYGMQIDSFHGRERIGHAGVMTGYGAVMALLPERRLGVVVLANGDGAVLVKVAERALELALPDLAPTPAASVPAKADAPSLDRLEGYIGTFANPRRLTVEVIGRNHGLVLRRFGRDFPMRAVRPDVFVVDRPKGGTETIAFGLGKDGRAEYLQMNVWALARTQPPGEPIRH